MHLHSLRVFLASLLFAASLHAASPYQAGDTFEAFTTKDQHDRPYTFAPGVRHVIVSFVMGTGRDANAFFAKQPADYLDRHQAIFVSNIHGMPGIGRRFALPKMKKYPHRILLADEEHFLDRYPAQERKLTVLDLDADGKVASVRFLDPEKEMDALFPSQP
ncbi:MAG TPA: hypothetical protein VGD81_14220 [Opitutaceae bacterium]